MIESVTASDATPLVVSCRGAFEELPGRCDEMNVRRAIVVAGGAVDALADEARGLLGHRWAGRFSHPVPHVPAKEANLAVASAQEIHADGVISIGGGSAIGYGKVIAFALRLPLIAVPTTYAGAEMTDRFLVTTEKGKESQRNERALPRLVLRDPAVTVRTPAALTASSGMTAVVHCLEALCKPRGDHASVRSALRALWSALPPLLDRPDDLSLREQALRAAGVAGTAQREHGAGPLTVLAERLGGRYLVDHGAVLGYVAAGALGSPGPAAEAARQALTEVSGADTPADRVLTGFADRLGLPTDPAAIGVAGDPAAVAASVGELFDDRRE
ncbi:iron-containing alcohol dehydrogenase [Actinoallomurus rhizosphaericola]|uniref:iron-containing alcohol dehydrogenase n=1 Tax=Actinoallomurus rhizosphaericola TaxID=2952536 RepID=UPI00209294EB|nr:iron-containing alcohol dehydrogenase [Actinoallomurus rhizosphaericola]MCO5998976.1 iron-containing alcohol dehydrogenase [Actinoallomurus rhizosphaericola]